MSELKINFVKILKCVKNANFFYKPLLFKYLWFLKPCETFFTLPRKFLKPHAIKKFL